MRANSGTKIETPEVCVFLTKLGWIAILGSAYGLAALTFGHRSKNAAVRAILKRCATAPAFRSWNVSLIDELRAYASGKKVTFLEYAIDWRAYTAFQSQIMQSCREIPWGEVVSYGELARRAGYPKAARAVGNCMAANPIPLVVPCHRVLGSNGRLCGYSGPGGVKTKLRLLQLETIGILGSRASDRPARRSISR